MWTCGQPPVLQLGQEQPFGWVVGGGSRGGEGCTELVLGILGGFVAGRLLVGDSRGWRRYS